MDVMGVVVINGDGLLLAVYGFIKKLFFALNTTRLDDFGEVMVVSVVFICQFIRTIVVILGIGRCGGVGCIGFG